MGEHWQFGEIAEQGMAFPPTLPFVSIFKGINGLAVVFNGPQIRVFLYERPRESAPFRWHGSILSTGTGKEAAPEGIVPTFLRLVYVSVLG
jgi:hypothetical protein